MVIDRSYLPKIKTYHSTPPKILCTYNPQQKRYKNHFFSIETAVKRPYYGFYQIAPACQNGRFYLTLPVKIGYNAVVLSSIISFVLRIWLIVAFWAFIWGLVKPKTQMLRILRATLLLLGLLGILAALKIAGQ